jgi:3-oxoacyl-[acyl-carrier-protein] synthase-3
LIRIDSIYSSLGSLSETNADIEEIVGWSADEILKKTGIKKRFISSNDETSESLGLNATRKIHKDVLSNCDLIISVSNTQSNDFPTIAHFVHSELGLSQRVKCFGINAGCTGFVDAIELVYSLFSSDSYKQALIINSDTYSKYINNDRSTRTLFSDGASVTVIVKDPNGFKIEKKISSSVSGTYENLIKKELDGERLIKMNGPKVLQFAMSTVKKDLMQIINKHVEYTLFPHQAGKIVLDALERKLPKNIKIFNNYQSYGNLVSASIPNLIRENFKELNKNKIILSGFGVGLSHNALILQK